MSAGGGPRTLTVEAMPDVQGSLTADVRGRVLGSVGSAARDAAGRAAATAALVEALGAAGRAAGVGGLEQLIVKGAAGTAVTVVRGEAFVVALLEPGRGTVEVERALAGWIPPAPESAPAAADPWAALRRALARGQLTEASARGRGLGPAPAGPPVPGAEPLEAAERDGAMQVLLEGIGSVLAGDGVGGGRTLRALLASAQPNLSLRWAALHWSAWAALRSGAPLLARGHTREALLVARQLDLETQAVSQWTAAEVLVQDGEVARALSWIKEARSRFERLGDRWGLGRTWLAEARILVASQREAEGAEAARRAWADDPAWDEPAVFLASRALARNQLDEAAETIRNIGSLAADRVRALVEAVREGSLAQENAAELLRLQEAPPSAEALRTLERIARGSPGLVQAREALAWMLLKAGRAEEAGAIFRALLDGRLTAADRASVMLGLGCLPAHAPPAGRPEVAPQAAAGPAGGAPPLPGAGGVARAPGQGPGGTGAVFSGLLGVFALPDLLEFLRGARRSGLLVCSSPAGIGALRFREGRIAGARSPATPALGELLVRAGKLSPEKLQEALELQQGEHSDQAIGELLVRESLAEAEAVRGALREQIDLAIRELVLWKDGEFAFSRDEGVAPARGLEVEVDPQVVMLNVFKDLDEAARGPADGAKR